MAIESVDFHYRTGSEGSVTTAVRVLGSSKTLEFEPISRAQEARAKIKDGDRLIGWLDVDLVVADQEDVEGMNFDIVGVINASSR